jgi:FkbM family methyltransferase
LQDKCIYPPGIEQLFTGTIKSITMKLYTAIKQSIQKAIWPYGSVSKIIRGHLKGYKFLVTENSGWSPILGRYEPTCHDVFSHLVKPGQIVFDLGANNGIHSLLFSRLAGNAGKVFAFEPLPDNIEEIRKNCALNSISNVHIVDAAVGSHDGSVEFYLGGLSKEGSIVTKGESGKKIEVKLICLQTFINHEKVRPDFIKIDIEGAESEALDGMGGLINELKPVFFIELHSPEQDQKVSAIFQRKDYTLYKLKNNGQNDAGIPHLQKITNPALTYPHPEGIWGTIVALPD